MVSRRMRNTEPDGLKNAIRDAAFKPFRMGIFLEEANNGYEIQEFGHSLLQIRVSIDAGYRYFQVKVTEKLR